jgi:hypothetical protein
VIVDKSKELEIRIGQLIQIYKDSPGVTVTFIDLARVYELMLEVMKNNNVIGFQCEGK